MNRRRFRVRLFLACSVAALMAPPAAAADEQTPASAAPKLNVETVLDKLDHPCGLAPIPGTPAILLSESGAGRVVRFHPDKPGETSAVITGFPSSQSNGRVLDQSGPLGLVFL